jgi:hypothetical protein
MEKYIGFTDGEEFVKEGLAKLSQRKRQLQDDIAKVEIVMGGIERESVDSDFISGILESFDEIYRDDVKPYQKRELVYSTLTKIELSDKLLKVGMPLEQVSATSNGSTGLVSIPTSLRGAKIFLCSNGEPRTYHPSHLSRKDES